MKEFERKDFSRKEKSDSRKIRRGKRKIVKEHVLKAFQIQIATDTHARREVKKDWNIRKFI